MASKAQDARYAQLVAFNSAHLPADNNYTPRDMSTVENMLIEILNIRAMGRTDRWLVACGEWYSMVNNAKDVNELRWAIIEGSNKAMYANL